jgi:hypothetical protein
MQENANFLIKSDQNFNIGRLAQKNSTNVKYLNLKFEIKLMSFDAILESETFQEFSRLCILGLFLSVSVIAAFVSCSYDGMAYMLSSTFAEIFGA